MISNDEAVTRLRNALANLAMAWQELSPSAALPQVFPPPFSNMTEADWRRAVQLWRQHAADLLAALPPRGCPACGTEVGRWLFESYDGHPFHECAACGCWYEPKQVNSAVFDALFARSPEARKLAEAMMSSRDELGQRDADMARIGAYLDALLPLLPAESAPWAYLDTGCGVGHSLRAGRARGLRVQGVEVDTTALALARADGLPVVRPDEPVPSGPYHLLSFWETLEHIADPLSALEQFLPELAEDGLVAITVPNLNAPATRVLREACAWVHGGYNTPGHVNLFHLPALSRLLARAGLTVIDAEGQYSSNPIELVAFLGGRTRGAFDALTPPEVRGTLPPALVEGLGSVWPGAALLERLALASPILRVVACRTARAAVFAADVAERRRARHAQIEAEAHAMLASEPDYKAMAAALQREVGRRDGLLREAAQVAENLQQAAQREISLREELLAGARRELDQEISLREELLAARRELEQTIDARVRRVMRLVRRMTRRT